MIGFITDNIATIIAALLVLAVVAGVLIYMAHEKKRGGHCTGGCAGCGKSGVCGGGK